MIAHIKRLAANLRKVAGMFAAYQETNLKKKVEDTQKEKKEIKPDDKKAIEHLKKMSNNSKNLESGINEMSAALELFKAPEDEIERELRQLRNRALTFRKSLARYAS
jgi:hypothetical protein